MQRFIAANRINKRSSGKGFRGFTLVELIVVLAIIAILAVAGVFTAVGYVNKTRNEKNYQNAVTIYQTAQTALTKKAANGTLESWILGIPGFDVNDPDLYELTDKDTNFSRHKTIALTYNKQTSGNDEDKYLYELVSPYFYNPSVFKATFTVELDICVTNNNKNISYTANVLSAFYSPENGMNENYDGDTARSGGWDKKCRNNSSDGLPDRSEEYRTKTSFVGYYNGQSEGELPGNVTAVSIPWDPTYELQGHIIGPTEDESQAAGYLFNVRNGETLDVSWAIFDADRDTERDAEPGYNYRYSAREDHKEDIHISLRDDDNDNTKADLFISNTELKKVSYNTSRVFKTFEKVDNSTISRETVYGFITVSVQINNGTKTNMVFPIAKTLVKGDSRTGCPSDIEKGYYEYSITLDAMMKRDSGSDSSASSNWSSYYGIARLFNDRTPRNIYALLCKDSTNWEYYDDNGNPRQKTDLVNTYAARSINDPVYLASTEKDGDQMCSYYSVREHCARYDGEDDNTSFDDYIITGKAVVNTFFGDKVYDSSSSSGSTDYYGGTTWSSSGSEAVLTNCRHLYNIRWMSGSQICYRIVSNINWYVHSGNLYSSEVKVFPKNNKTAFNSPVDYDGTLRTVSFPAINKLPEDSTLTSISDSDRRTYKINGIQLRAGSFINDTDKGYGLFCENFGNINNVYINDLNLILNAINDGSACDYTDNRNSFNPDSSVSIGHADGSFNDCPVGSLVGYNKGIIGSVSETDDSINTVQVTNSIVMSGTYWKTSKCSDVGGVIGKNDGKSSTVSTYGLIKTAGKFIVIGNLNAGGIIGNNNSDISAMLVVDGSDNIDNEYSLPKLSTTGEEISCAVISNNTSGGAIGCFDKSNCKFAREVDSYSLSGPNTGTGELSFVQPDDYHINVTLPSNSVILQLNGNTNPSAGGAIGFLGGISGDYLGIYTNVSGYIISTGKVDSYCGGAVGSENDCKIKTIYLDCDNQAGSLIGQINTSTTNGPIASGGAIGRINTITGKANSSRTTVINVFNNGTISSRGTIAGTGSGGAIGGSVVLDKPFKIRAVNYSNSKIYGYGNNVDNSNGTGGAIGSFEDNCVLTGESVIYSENYGEISGKYHVGGAIGNSPRNRGYIYAVNAGTIKGIDFVGGAIGRSVKENSGLIQSILSSAYIEGEDFVGGAAGRLLYLQNGSTIRTHVKVSSTVNGTGYLVGGVCGDIMINNTNNYGTIELKGNNTNPTLNVQGGTNNVNAVGTGGVVGVLRTQTVDVVDIDIISPSQTDLNRLAIHVDGQKDVGGVIGRLVCNSSLSNKTTDVITASSKDINIQLSVKLEAQSHVVGSGENVGGAIGSVYYSGGKFTGFIDVESVYGNPSGESLISGSKNVGGAVGSFSKSFLSNDKQYSEIYVDFSASPWTIEGTTVGNNANVGGAIGYIEAPNNTSPTPNFPLTVMLGTSKVISDGFNVGGVIGYNNNSLKSVVIKAQLDVLGLVSGGKNVGGAIGYNYLKKSNGSLNSIESRINGTVSGNGECVGGAIGYNYATITSVTSTINGSVISTGDNVGGAIGNINSDKDSYHAITKISSIIQGSGVIEGHNNVGGAVGRNNSNIDTIKSDISGNSKVIGKEAVGGALGFASAAPGVVGNTVLGGTSYGRILNVYVNISADNALSGMTRMGGAVGQVGEKNSSTYNSACLVYVEATLNSAYLFDPLKTGTANNAADSTACIGGIIGIFVDGRLGVSGGGVNGGVVLKGSGGVVKTAKYIDTTYFPARTYSNAVFIGANGSSIGGLVGQIGYPGFQQNVYLSNLSADNGPDLCVASLNGKDRVGGWIGSGYAGHGGIGSENQTSFDKEPVYFNVNNVRAVISIGENGIGGSQVGGFCGSIDCENNNQFNDATFGTFAWINVNLTDANIIGASKVGGAFGETTYARFKSGGIIVTLRSNSNIGDVAGNALPGDSNEYQPICYEAGGAIGSVDFTHNKYNTFHVPVEVVIDSTSRVSGMAVPSDNSSDYGVGGAFGELNAKFSKNLAYQWVRVTGEDGSVASVCSNSANVGGVAGVIKDGDLYNAYANVTVKSNADGNSVGGIAGRIIKLTNSITNGGNTLAIDNCHFGPDSEITQDDFFSNDDLFGSNAVYDPSGYYIISTGSSIGVGGFAGVIDSTGDKSDIGKCYTTATVNAVKSDAVGGFVGKANKGTLKNCYSSGHTYSKHYISNNANVIGAGNVGGFVGQTTGAITFDTCYSTASVYGSGSNVGGFAGSTAGNAKVNNCYSTGLVTGSNAATTGSFVGNTVSTTYTNSCSMNGINRFLPLAGNAETVSGLFSRNASEIRGSNNDNAHPFDSSLGTTYELKAVINKEHWGDWPEADDERKNIALTTIVLEPKAYEYSKSGYHLESNLTITDESSGEAVPLEFGIDYTLEYSNVNGVGKNAKVIISGIGDYYGSVSETFEITKASIEDAVAVISYPAGYENGFQYTGGLHNPVSEVTLGADVLTEGKDYFLEYTPDNINIGTVTVAVVGFGNYVGRLENAGTFEIIGRNLGDAEVTLLNATEEELVYDGQEKRPGVTVRIDGKTLVMGEDYDVEYENNIDAGVATVRIVPHEGNEQYTGSKEVNFTITQAINLIKTEPEIADWTWNNTPSALEPELEAEFGEPVYSVYTDAECKTNRVVEPCEASEIQDAMTVLDAGDYYLFAEIVETGNYTGVSKIVPFTVERWDITGNVTVELEYTRTPFNGESQKPEVVVKYNGDETLDSENYTVSYSTDTTSVGTKTVTVTGTKNCLGTATADYEIIPVWTVKFYPEPGNIDGSIEPASVPVTDGEKVSPLADPVYDGYRFDGWYWYSNPSTFVPYDFTSTVNGDLDIYAKWTQWRHVTLVLNNGDDDIVVDVANGERMDEPEDPYREGYDFGGWYGNPECTNAWSFSVMIDNDYLIYAKWIPQVHTVTFESNGGSEVASQTLTYPDPLEEPEDPVLDQYRFDGWFTDEELTEAFDGFDSPVPEDITLYAKWTLLRTVTIVPNNGDEDQEIKVGDGENLPEPALTRNYYEFEGWYTDPECTTAWDGQPVEADITLYANWTPIEYTVTFEPNGGPEVASQKVSVEAELVKPEDPEYKGYRFDGWYSDEECTQLFEGFDQTYTNGFTLYAKWTKAAKVTLKLYDGADDIVLYVEDGKKFAKPDDPLRDDYVFDGWFTDPGCTAAFNGFDSVLTDDIVLYANWKDE